ncbi:MAG: hypothetical protein WCS09_20450 [Pseudomonadota bacterium]
MSSLRPSSACRMPPASAPALRRLQLQQRLVRLLLLVVCATQLALPASVTAMQVIAARAAAGLCLPGTSVPFLDRKDGRGVDDPLVHAACAVCMFGSTGHAGPARPASPAPSPAAIAVASVDPGARHGAAAHLRPGSRAPPGTPLA